MAVRSRDTAHVAKYGSEISHRIFFQNLKGYRYSQSDSSPAMFDLRSRHCAGVGPYVRVGAMA